ncbi:uncharacterized protein ASPGLDRAFT_27172 [Aspergillus glaucus CBS 516.65]|uniref:Uncharacterized protein n=1 Tax=Aspergillus glaucus CBS 516.65 TaxID=1160497 RepID=A0A1L9VER3_ASPGL|nr:hypothetical protein ASPGLDRAFT_27172 [Aspergillus glaucus CBS 516.65]OJJ82312.1 hypothetical protein ASPGLDRAFT_27172 [Aspergillus glaucus CBS 516.65]
MSVSINSLIAAKIASGPAIPEISFTGLESLENFADKQVSAFHESTTESQYILIRKIPRHIFEEIDETDHGLSGTRMHYDYKTGDLIAKLVPSLEQHAVPLHLAYSLYRRIDAMDTDRDTLEYFLVGRATFRGSDLAKQGDWGFKPLPEREFCDDWPTFVMEVGCP